MVDYVRVSIKAGKGGDGAVSFRRERFIPRGGPDGGDGGRGGSVYFETDPNINTLDVFAHNQKIWAQDGKKGMHKKMSGVSADDLVVKVPVGMVLKLRSQMTDDRSQVIQDKYKEIDFDKEGMRVCVAKGGRGGKGNVHFKSSRNTTPMEAEKGELGEEFEAEMELKLLADVGLVGLPNAGKSTLLSVLSNARPKVADYEFTTLEPNLGVMKYKEKTFVIADIPGLVEGASEGKGLGTKFLKHIERTKVLVHLVPASDEDVENIYSKYQKIRRELGDFGAGLEDKKEIVVLSKIDLIENQGTQDIVKYFKKKKIEILPISSGSGEGIERLKAMVVYKLD